jgi:hypothetical protein
MEQPSPERGSTMVKLLAHEDAVVAGLGSAARLEALAEPGGSVSAEMVRACCAAVNSGGGEL